MKRTPHDSDVFVSSHKKAFFAKKHVRDLKKQIKDIQCEIQDKQGKRWLRLHVKNLNEQLEQCNQQLKDLLTNTTQNKYTSLVDEYKNAIVVHKYVQEDIGEVGAVYDKVALERELKEELDRTFTCKRKRSECVPIESIAGGDMCESCDVHMEIVMSQALMICPKCNVTRMYIQNTTQNIAYGTNVIYQNFSYKKKNHFSDNLLCFQAKEVIHVPDQILNQIMDILHRRGYKVKDVTQKVVLSILKELKLRKYYEHMPKITSILTGIYPPRFTLEQESFIKRMFDALQEPFLRHKPSDRKNFLSYNYVTLKMVELRGWDYFLPYLHIRKLKGSDKRLKQDSIYKKCCKDLGWQFIPTV